MEIYLALVILLSLPAIIHEMTTVTIVWYEPDETPETGAPGPDDLKG